MAIQNDWYIDYQNHLIAHATFTVDYDAQTANFHVGATVTATSGGTAVIVNDTDGGTTGTLDLVYVTGTFTDNATLTDDFPTTPGSATQNGDLIAKTAVYTARQLYSFLQDTFDELIQMDDTVPMQAQTPTEFTLINGWFIDDISVRYLSGGAIDTLGYNNEIQVLTLDGTYTGPLNSDIGLYVSSTLNGGEVGPLLAFNNNTQKWWIRSSTQITNNSVITIPEGSSAGGDAAGNSTTGEDLYSNIYTLGTITIDPKPKTYIFQNSASLDEWWGRGDVTAHIDVLVKSRESGGPIGNGTVTVFIRHFGDTYDHFNQTVSERGRYAVPLANATDRDNNITGEIRLTVSATTDWTVGEFARDTTTGAYGEVLNIDAVNDYLYIGNVILGDVSPYVFDVGNTVYESSDGILNNGDASSTITAIDDEVRGYNDIKVLFMNITLPFNSGSEEPAVGAQLTGAVSGANAYYISSTVSSGSWSGGDATGTMYLANWDSTSWNSSEDINIVGGTADIATTTNSQTVEAQVNKNFEQGDPFPYNVVVECAGRTMAEVYEWFKYITREDANSTQTNYQTMYRVDTGAIVEEDGEEYIAAQTAYTPVKASPFGTLAGGRLFGARGVWLEGMATADRQNFSLIDAQNSPQTPPNFITITVNSVISGDKVSVFRTTSGTTINKAQFTSGAGNTAGSSTFIVTDTIPSDTPNYGYLRVVDFSDTSTLRESRYAYSAWSNTTNSFTLSGSTTLDRTYVDGEDTAYVPYYDEVAGNTSVYVTVIFAENQSVLTRVRRYNGTGDSIIPFQIAGSVGTTGYTVAAIRTPDSIVA